MLGFRTLWRGFRRRDRFERDLDDELRATLDLLAAEKLRAGLTRPQAERAARLELGSVEAVKDQVRDALGVRLVDDARRDLRLAVRSLRASPLVTFVAVLSLALAIGANAAIFSIVNGLMLRALPVREPARLVMLTDAAAAPRVRVWEYSFWQQLQQRPQLFESAAAWSFTRFNLAAGGESQFVEGLWATASFFDTLGVGAALGRTFSDADDRRGGGPGGPVTVISHAYWQRRFGGAADVIGRGVRLNGVPYTIVGIMPPRFFGTEVGRAFDFIAPLQTEPLSRGRDSSLDNPGSNFLTVIARLGAGQSRETLTAALRRAQPGIREAMLQGRSQPPSQGLRDRYLREPFTAVAADTGFSNLRAQYERPLLAISAVVGLLLLVACANVANLLLARALARRQELRVRMALGASRWRLARQLFTESLVLAIAGAALGVAMAPWIGGFLVRQLSTPANVVFLDTSIDLRVLVFTVAVTAITALLFCTAPAFRAARVSLVDTLKERGHAIARLQGGTAGWLVAVQVALSVVLVASAGLFIRSFASLASRELGFEPERVLVVTLDPERTTVDEERRQGVPVDREERRQGVPVDREERRQGVPVDREERRQGVPVDRESQRRGLYERVRRAVLSLPDVGDAAISFLTPIATGGLTPPLAVEGVAPAMIRDEVFGNPISPGWFTTFGMRLVAGRDITERDRSGAPRVAIVNETFARRYLGSGNPLGRTITIWPNTPRALRMEVVGVAADAVYFSARAPVPPSWYSPIAQFDAEGFPFSPVRLSVRPRSGPPALLTRQVEAAIASVDPQLALVFRPLDESVHDSLIRERLLAQLGGFVGVLALLLAGLGLYGVTAYTVSRRRTEIGIRMALGAAAAAVIWLVLGRVSMIVGGGIVIGTAISLWASTFVSELIYGLQPRDSATLGATAVVLCVTAAVAAWLPTRRAVRIDPATVLRES